MDGTLKTIKKRKYGIHKNVVKKNDEATGAAVCRKTTG